MFGSKSCKERKKNKKYDFFFHVCFQYKKYKNKILERMIQNDSKWKVKYMEG